MRKWSEIINFLSEKQQLFATSTFLTDDAAVQKKTKCRRAKLEAMWAPLHSSSCRRLVAQFSSFRTAQTDRWNRRYVARRDTLALSRDTAGKQPEVHNPSLTLLDTSGHHWTSPGNLRTQWRYAVVAPASTRLASSVHSLTGLTDRLTMQSQ